MQTYKATGVKAVEPGFNLEETDGKKEKHGEKTEANDPGGLRNDIRSSYRVEERESSA